MDGECGFPGTVALIHNLQSQLFRDTFPVTLSEIKKMHSVFVTLSCVRKFLSLGGKLIKLHPSSGTNLLLTHLLFKSI